MRLSFARLECHGTVNVSVSATCPALPSSSSSAQSLLFLSYCCCCIAKKQYLTVHDLEYSVIRHCWDNVVKLTSKHGREASWEDPDLPCVLGCGQSPCLFPSSSLQLLLWDPPQPEESFSGFLALVPTLSASLMPPASPMPPSVVSALAFQTQRVIVLIQRNTALV